VSQDGRRETRDVGVSRAGVGQPARGRRRETQRGEREDEREGGQGGGEPGGPAGCADPGGGGPGGGNMAPGGYMLEGAGTEKPSEYEYAGARPYAAA